MIHVFHTMELLKTSQLFHLVLSLTGICSNSNWRAGVMENSAQAPSQSFQLLLRVTLALSLT